MTASELARHFGMAPHPEGGFYVQTYKSRGMLDAGSLPDGWGPHAYSTGILFLLRSGECSHLHRIRQDEMWHFYLGGPLQLAMLHPGGAWTEQILGRDVMAGQHVQFTVPAGCWFGATPCPGTEWSLVGCTVAPGFEFTDFEIADRGTLAAEFPQHRERIMEFTTDPEA